MAGNADDLGDLINFANAMKEAFSDPADYSSDKRNALGKAIKEFDKGSETRPTPIDYYLPAILKYAQVPDATITTEGLVSHGYTYTYEGELLIEFFKALGKPDDEIDALIYKIETESYLTKEIYSVWNPQFE